MTEKTRSAETAFAQMDSERGGWGEDVVAHDWKNTVPQALLAIPGSKAESKLASDFQI